MAASIPKPLLLKGFDLEDLKMDLEELKVEAVNVACHNYYGYSPYSPDSKKEIEEWRTDKEEELLPLIDKAYELGYAKGIAEALTPKPIEDAPQDGPMLLGLLFVGETLHSAGRAYYSHSSRAYEFMDTTYSPTHFLEGLPTLILP